MIFFIIYIHICYQISLKKEESEDLAISIQEIFKIQRQNASF